MSYIRKSTLAEIPSGEPDVAITPETLIQTTWIFGGNTVSAEKKLGTLADFDVPIVRNNVEKIKIDNVTWTGSSFPTTAKFGANGSGAAIRFPLNSSVQHGIVSLSTGVLRFVIANGESSGSTLLFSPITINASGKVGINQATATAELDVNGITSSTEFRINNLSFSKVGVGDSGGGFVGGYNITITTDIVKHDSTAVAYGIYKGPSGVRIYASPSAAGGTNATERIRIKTNGVHFAGAQGPTDGTALLHLGHGDTGAGKAPLKFSSSDLLSTPEAGAVEFLTDRIYFTKTTGPTRETLAYLSDIATGFVNNGNSFGGLATLGTNDSNALVFETNNTEAVRIDTSQNVGIGTTPSTKLHLNGGVFRQQQTNVILDNNVFANVDVDNPFEVIASVTAANYSAGFFDYVVHNSDKSSMRAGTLQVVWNASTVEFHEFSTLDIGTTTDVVFSATINGANLEIRGVVASNNWIIKGNLRTIN